MLTVSGLSFNYGSKKVLDRLSITIEPGESVALIGSSGSGKTTLLRLIAGILSHKNGTIIKPDLAYMTQQDLLLPWRSILKNIELPLELEGHSKKSALDWLEKMELLPYKNYYPDQLSGGMYKRAMLARALAQNKPLLLLDEPFGSLDLPLRDRLYSRLKSLTQSSILLVTHDFRDAFYLADKILLLKEGSIKNSWIIDKARIEDPHYIGQMFQDLKIASS